MAFKKFFLLFFSLITFFPLLAQLGTTHYLPPLHTRVGISKATIYLSTPYGDATNPVNVEITTGSGEVLATREIWNGSPSFYEINLFDDSPILVEPGELNTPLRRKGLIINAQDVVYVSLRTFVNNHAGYLTTKGEDALGTRFRLGSARLLPSNGSHSFFASVIAVEDNTTITFSDYNASNMVFENGLNPSTTLNAGESYVVSGYSGPTGNSEGFIGALLESDKPIVVNTGNLNGNFYQGEFAESLSDMLIDQIVDESKTGFEYMLIRGGGNDSSEVPVIVANKDNTDIYVNGQFVTNMPNAGDFLYLEDPSFYLPATGVQHRNMYITTNDPEKTLYVYQMIAGRSGTNGGNNFPSATPGMNFIPPLSCFFQNTVDLIPEITEMYPGNSEQFTGDILITARVGTSVNVNGNSLDQNNALTNPGTPDWETYYVSGLSGNAIIEADGPIAAGLFGAFDSAGYAGYYSGFAVNPEDTTTYICQDGGPINLLDRFSGNPPEGGFWTPPLASGTNIYDPYLDSFTQYVYEVTGICADVSITIDIILEETPVILEASNIVTCPNLLGDNVRPDQNVATINLRDRDIEISGGNNDVRVDYYETFDDALSDSNAIEDADDYTTSNSNETIYARVYNINAGCGSIDITEFSIEILPAPYANISQEDNYICINPLSGIADTPLLIDGTVENTVDDVDYFYNWSNNGNSIGSSPILEIYSGGTYRLEVTARYANNYECSFYGETEIIESSSPSFNLNVLEGSFFGTGLYTVEVTNITGINANTSYEWSIDDGEFQSETIFYNITAGDHYVTGRAVDADCAEIRKLIEIIDYPRFFTPNGDGINDTWNIINLDNSLNQNATILVFDRFGKLLKQIDPVGSGWDGTYNGQPMPSSDYWFRVEFTEVEFTPADQEQKPRIVNGHFTLKR